MKKNVLRKLQYAAGILVLLAAVIFSGYKLIMAVISDHRAQAEHQRLLEAVVTEEVRLDAPSVDAGMDGDDGEPETVPPQYPPLSIDMAQLNEMNGDFRGWFYFPAVEVSYPIVQGEDNEYYLKHSFEDEKSNSGSIFMDCGASPDWSDRNTFVFGHNMRDGSMFGAFRRLVDDPSLLDANPRFYIYTKETVYTYEIFSYYMTKSSSNRYMVFTSDENYDIYTQWAVENSNYNFDVDLSERANIVSLSSCYGSAGTSRRVLIHGVLTLTEPYGKYIE
ncbi:MAG: class B sortase [bacterium]|nr:class B sortase [bacterium]MCM1376718.1 class B sortase [Muribaculum sp.]